MIEMAKKNIHQSKSHKMCPPTAINAKTPTQTWHNLLSDKKNHRSMFLLPAVFQPITTKTTGQQFTLITYLSDQDTYVDTRYV